jgi:hypothetical protein
MTQYPDLFAALGAPFEANEVKVRSQGNRQVQYITARTAMNRLDTVLGPENWWDEYLPGDNSVLCKLTIRLPDPEGGEGGGWTTLTKADAGGYAGMPDQGDDDKSGYSDAFKRAAVKFGVGRYLYRDGVPVFGRDRTDPQPAPAHDQVEPPIPAEKTVQVWGGGGQSPPPGDPGKCPGSGRGLFAKLKELETHHQVGLIKYLNGWAKLQEFPGRMVDWDQDQVQQGWAEVRRKLATIGHAEAIAS